MGLFFWKFLISKQILSPEVTFPSDLRTDEDKRRYRISFINGYNARVRQIKNQK